MAEFAAYYNCNAIKKRATERHSFDKGSGDHDGLYGDVLPGRLEDDCSEGNFGGEE
ncbi:hypothetical protein L13192_08677 [Pyrenophora tritici-repentis]|nr:hypothetical protein L13192_08677 [Pyrenophora tritici-repentis]